MLQALVHGLNTALRARLQANRAGPPPGFTVEPQPLKSTQSQHPRFAAGEGRVGGESGREGDARLSVAAIALLKRATVRQKAAHMVCRCVVVYPHGMPVLCWGGVAPGCERCWNLHTAHVIRMARTHATDMRTGLDAA